MSGSRKLYMLGMGLGSLILILAQAWLSGMTGDAMRELSSGLGVDVVTLTSLAMAANVEEHYTKREKISG